jgi:hypothetical protein
MLKVRKQKSTEKRRTDYLHIPAHSAQQDLSGDDHLSMYVTINQNGPCIVCIVVSVNWRAEVQTQMFVGEVIAYWSREMLKIPLLGFNQHQVHI